MWSVTNYFLLNLSVADILMAALNCTVSFLYMRDRLETLVFLGVLVGFDFNKYFQSLEFWSSLLSFEPVHISVHGVRQCLHDAGHHPGEKASCHEASEGQNHPGGRHHLPPGHLESLLPDSSPSNPVLQHSHDYSE